jgi:FemAB-related protein (PEP-CTERM system-associated)
VHHPRVRVVALGADASASEAAWDRFVAESPDATPFHRIAWRRVVEDVFGHAPHYLVALDGGAIRGVLPLFAVRGLRSGRVVLSVPYATYGGVCGTDADAQRALVDAARSVAQRVGARHVELRQLFHPLPDVPTRSPFATFTRTLDPDPDATFRAIPRRRRNMVRKGVQHGLDARVGWEPLAEFHVLYAVHRRTLGAPPFPLRMLEAIRDGFATGAELLTIRHGRRLVGGVVSFLHGDRVMPHYGATLPDARGLAVADFMYWELMRRACLAGCRVFDFGDSHVGSGTWTFKHLWGFAPEPIAYQYVLVGDREPPSREPSRVHPLVHVWKRLPLALTTRLGPSVIRWLPLY